MWHSQESKEVTDDLKTEGATLHEINENMQLVWEGRQLTCKQKE